MSIGTDQLIPPKPKIKEARMNVAMEPLKVRNFTLYERYAINEAIKIETAML